MNLERLRAVQAAEREADSLRPLPDDFYREVADYLGELRAERERAAESAADPFGSDEVRRLTDEIETAEEVAEAIYERRVGKLVKRATLAASGMPADEEGLTAEESELFAELVSGIEAHREEVLADFDGGRSAEALSGGERPDEPGGDAPPATAEDAAPPPPDDPTADPALDAGAAMGRGDDGGDGSTAGSTDDRSTGSGSSGGSADDPTATSEATEAAGEDDDPDRSTDGGATDRRGGDDVDGHERVTLRITRDVGEVFGVDERTYDLASEDVVTLPAANAKPLLDRDAAEQID